MAQPFHAMNAASLSSAFLKKLGIFCIVDRDRCRITQATTGNVSRQAVGNGV